MTYGSVITRTSVLYPAEEKKNIKIEEGPAE